MQDVAPVMHIELHRNRRVSFDTELEKLGLDVLGAADTVYEICFEHFAADVERTSKKL